MPLKNVENGAPNGVTSIVFDSTCICKPELPSFFKVSYRMCTVRHITIKILHGSHNLVWALRVEILISYQSMLNLKPIIASCILYSIYIWMCKWWILVSFFFLQRSNRWIVYLLFPINVGSYVWKTNRWMVYSIFED